MAVLDFTELEQALLEHPEWRERLRRLVLTEELLSLPELVRELIVAGRRTDERLAALTERVEELAEAQRRTEAQLAALASNVHELTEAQKRSEATTKMLADRQAHLSGMVYEMRLAHRFAAIFGPILRRLRVVLPLPPGQALPDLMDETLSRADFESVLALDLLARGVVREPYPRAGEEVWLAVEVSGLVDQHDLERARLRAGILRRAGVPTVAVVASEAATEGVRERLEAAPAVLVLDGSSLGWEAALAGAGPE